MPVAISLITIRRLARDSGRRDRFHWDRFRDQRFNGGLAGGRDSFKDNRLRPLFARGTLFSSRPVFPRSTVFPRWPVFAWWAIFAWRTPAPVVASIASPVASTLGAGFPLARNLVVLFVFFEEIRHVKERVAFQPQVHEGRLHARQNSCDPAFVNAASQRIFVGALKIHLYQLIVFENGHFRFVAIRRDHHFLGHLVLRVPGRGRTSF